MKTMPVPAKTVTPAALTDAWRRYVTVFGRAPHGTEKQMAALLELVREEA